MLKATETETPAGVITTVGIKTVNIYRLLLEVRNRYFHFRTGERGDNFSFSESITNPEDLFRTLNDVMLNWLSMIISNLIVEEYNNTD
jgi:hypothetical protein